ncbi:hypothetical protein LCGC14_1869160 [marine sediment metagenome]|uniref:HTH cro/C1-type domain-containing protein n=1 Tax=marine sediment metagenome TaxID=412755 RepID=A0A0F9G5K3_9ZZZZ
MPVENKYDIVRRKLNDKETLVKQGLTLREIERRADVKPRWLQLIKSGKQQHPYQEMIERVYSVLTEAGV